MISTTATGQVETKSASLIVVRPPVQSETGEHQRPRSAARRMRNVDLRGPAGRLEALLNEGAPDAGFTALVCHPHPLGGGTLHNKVVYHATKVLNDSAWGLGLPVLRFNFRGTGLSQGTHDGEAEVEDVVAGLEWLENAFRLPVIAVGFSFGAFMALKACCRPERIHTIRALVALGLPIEAQSRKYDYSFLKDAVIPKLFVSGERDQFAPAAQLHQVVEFAAAPKRLIILPRADHFFTSQLEPMQQAMAGWLKEQLA